MLNYQYTEVKVGDMYLLYYNNILLFNGNALYKRDNKYVLIINGLYYYFQVGNMPIFTSYNQTCVILPDCTIIPFYNTITFYKGYYDLYFCGSYILRYDHYNKEFAIKKIARSGGLLYNLAHSKEIFCIQYTSIFHIYDIQSFELKHTIVSSYGLPRFYKNCYIVRLNNFVYVYDYENKNIISFNNAVSYSILTDNIFSFYTDKGTYIYYFTKTNTYVETKNKYKYNEKNNILYLCNKKIFRRKNLYKIEKC